MDDGDDNDDDVYMGDIDNDIVVSDVDDNNIRNSEYRKYVIFPKWANATDISTRSLRLIDIICI